MNIAGDYGQALANLGDWAGKATVLITLAWCASLLLRRRSAALRHQVWAIAIIGALVLPLASWVVPAWHLISAPAATVVQAPARVSISMSDADVSTVAVQKHWDWDAMIPAVLALWAIGAGIFLLRLAAGFARLRRAAAYSKVVTADCLTALAVELRARFGVRRTIRMLESASATTMPMTWGIFRPRIVLPCGVDGWDEQRKRIVLSHELAHVSRCDWAFQICAELLRGCFWFHPLAWISAKWLRQESECACDDAVLNSGVAAEEYASELLTLTQTLKTPGRRFSLALAISRPTNLETRFAAMLNTSTSRKPLSRKARSLAVACGVLLLLPLAALTLSAAPPRESPLALAATSIIEPAAVPSIEALPEVMPPATKSAERSGSAAIQANGTTPGGTKGSAEAGRATFVQDCAGCHSPETATSLKLDAKGWTDEVNQMVQLGASIPKADFPVLVNYLTTNFGPKSVNAIEGDASPRAAGFDSPGTGGPSAGAQTTAPTPAAAQTAPASLNGVVEDPSGAVIPGAVVRLIQSNAATPLGAMALVVPSGSAGEFAFSSVVPDSYQLTVQQPGFRTYSQKDIQLQAGEHLNLHAVDLQIGTIAQEVTVTARAGASVGGPVANIPPAPCTAAPAQAPPPPPSPRELSPGRIRVGGTVEPAWIACQTMPIYPAAAKLHGVDGTVVMNAIIGKDGMIQSLTVVNGDKVDSSLADAALAAVKQWRYTPAMLDGQPVELETEISVVFTLNRN